MKLKNCLILLFGFLLFAGCKKSSTYKGSGSVVFYITTNTHGSVALTIKNSTFTVPVTNNPDTYCTSGYTGYVYLDIGTYNYSAIAADGTKWNNSIEIIKDYCLPVKLQ